MFYPASRWLLPAFGSLALTLAFVTPSQAQWQSYSLTPPTVGSGNVADADPPVIRPTTTPCFVQLFNDFQSGPNSESFNYAPPADCPGPWSKVVFVGDFGDTGTNQFDRTAQILLGNVMIYYGTTQEPSPTEQPKWHVESDVTDYSALFKSSQTGTFSLGNYVEGPYCCSQYVSAYLEFYPANPVNPAPKTASQVLSLTSTPGAQGLGTGEATISQTFTLPTNIEKAYLDVYLQGQNEDEFWWSCIPNNALPILGAEYNCGNTPFRQSEIWVDGKPAGIAPVIPYVFTGGVDPDFWRPIPGIQTLDFKPYRVDLTPFAAKLSNGEKHTISFNVDNADNYFLADATLLLFQDPGSSTVTGDLTGDTLGPIPNPAVVEDLANYATTGAGSITVQEGQLYTVSGYVNTSHGRVDTTVEGQLSFTNTQVYTAFTETLTQETKAYRKSSTTEGPLTYEAVDNIVFPFSYSFSESLNSDGSGSETLGITQKLTENTSNSILGVPFYESIYTVQVAPIDELDFNASGELTSEPIDTNTETYTYGDTQGHCWSRSVSANDALVSAVSDGQGCPHGKNQWY